MILHAGPFALRYQDGFIRYLRYGELEVIRMLYFALRDENWGTLDSRIENEKIEHDDRSFRITYTRYSYNGDTTFFKWGVMITGSTQGEITFEIQGECLEAIKKNRAGFCILHPIAETKGQSCTIIHPDGTETRSSFPETIDPLNPFLEIRSMQWMSEGKVYQLDFTGDIFETEDQRNWTDASFKTFCTPLSVPFPVQLNKGDKVHQRIAFKAVSDVPTTPNAVDDVIYINRLPQTEMLLPSVGIGSSTETTFQSTLTTTRLKALSAGHYRVEVHPVNEGWIDKLHSEFSTASQLGLTPEVVVHVTSAFTNELASLLAVLKNDNASPKSILVLSAGALTTQQSVIDHLIRLKRELGTTPIGAGTAFNFTELNRNRFNADGLDFVSYSIHPQEHAFDDATLIENISAQSDTVVSARNIYPGKDIYISPVTLRKRYNPYTANPSERVISEKQKADPRQKQPINGPWLLGSVKSLAQASASSITYFQTIGNQGVVAADGQPFPVYAALQMLFNYRGYRIVPSNSNRPLLANAIVFKKGDSYAALLFNYTDLNRQVVIGTNKVELGPYAVKEIMLPSF